MTYKAGTQLDLTDACDSILEYMYFRKSQELVDIDQGQIDLNFSYEKFEIAVKKLESDGYISLTNSTDGFLGKITTNGEVYYRTGSYKNNAKTEKIKSLKENFRLAKDIIELVLAIMTIVLAIYTINLDRKIKLSNVKMIQLEKKIDSLELINKTFRNQSKSIKTKLESKK